MSTQLPGDAAVIDLVYRAGETPWVRAARRPGIARPTDWRCSLHRAPTPSSAGSGNRAGPGRHAGGAGRLTATRPRAWRARWPHLLLPRCCVACDARLPETANDLVCGTCWSRLPTLPSPQCVRCGYPLADGDCRWCVLASAVRASGAIGLLGPGRRRWRARSRAQVRRMARPGARHGRAHGPARPGRRT